MSALYLNHSELRTDLVVLQVADVPTVVVSVVDYPMDGMSALFDQAFCALFPARAAAGITPVAPPFSLHHRMPTETGDFEVGIPVDKALTEPIDVDASASRRPRYPVATSRRSLTWVPTRLSARRGAA